MALEESATTSGMIKLDSSNYSLWKPMMEDILYCKDLYEPIGKDKIPTGVTEEEWRVLHRKAIGMIRLYINQNIFHHVANDTNAYEMWQKLESMYERKTSMNKASVIKRLAKLEYRDGTSVIEHMNVFQCHINQLSPLKINFEDEVQALLLLSSMPDSWNTLVVSLSNSAPDGKMTLEMVKNSMLNEEARKKEKGDASSSDAYVAETHGKNENRGHSNTRFQQGKNKSRERSKSKLRKDISCFHCGNPGHIKSECRKYKRELAEGKLTKKTEQKAESSSTMTATDEHYLVIEDSDSYSVVRDDAMSWVVDSGASFHITSHKEYFTSYTSGVTGQVRMGNSGSSAIVGKGSICIETNTGCGLVLDDVRHVPDIRLNLLSVGKLDDIKHPSYFGEGKWKLTKGSLIVARGSKQGNLYVTKTKLCNEVLNIAEKDTSVELWHKRLGHMSEKGMHALARMEYLPELKENVLDIMHIDVCSMTEKSHGEALYFVNFIDDHSRKVFVYVLKHEYQTLEAFKEFHAKVERETGRKLKCVRSNNGGEYRGPFERLWDPVNRKIMRSRDVVFIEDETIKDIGKPEKPMTNTPQVDMDPICPPLIHDNHGGDDDTEESGDATDQGSTSQSGEQPSSDDDDEVGNDDANENLPDSPLVQ
nr:uncharacterized protein LOC120966742 [Aegilops tauschii subsp. strangulata]